MSGLSWLDIFLRLIPEGLIIILAGYALSKKNINTKRYLLSSIILAISIYAFKLLPISAALPMILSIITAIIVLIFVNKINTVHAIISSIICFMLLILTEAVNLFILEKLLNVDIKGIFQNGTPILKYLSGLPSLLVFAAIVLSYYFISRRKRAANVTNE